AERSRARSLEVGHEFRASVSGPHFERSDELDCTFRNGKWEWCCRRPGVQRKWTLRAVVCNAKRESRRLWIERVSSVSSGNPDRPSTCEPNRIEHNHTFVGDKLGGIVLAAEYVFELEQLHAAAEFRVGVDQLDCRVRCANRFRHQCNGYTPFDQSTVLPA